MASTYPDAVVCRAAGQVSCALGEEAAILNLRNDTYYGLDAVGARIWDLIAAPRQVSQLRDALLSEFEVSAERCEQDLQTFITELHGAGLIEVTGGAADETPDAAAR